MRLTPAFGIFFSAFVLSSFLSTAWGHGVDLFARVEGTQLVGKVTFADGIPVKNAPVRAFAPDGSTMEEATTDESGAFTMPIRFNSRYRLVCEAGQGHRGLYTVPASEITETAVTRGDDEASISPSQGGGAAISTGGIDPVQLEALLARQLGPLRDQLHGYETQVRLRDVFGGIGYVFGLVGLYILVKKRKSPGKSA